MPPCPRLALVLAAVVLTGCAAPAPESQTATSSSSEPASPSSSSSTSPSPSSTSSTTATEPTAPDPDDAMFDLAVTICTEGLAEPDTLIYDATVAAREGTRSEAEILGAFTDAQDGVEALADEAEAGGATNLAASLQAYADTLGRARVSGDVGLDGITDAREAVDAACYSPGPTAG